jgi:hypothetical protein
VLSVKSIPEHRRDVWRLGNMLKAVNEVVSVFTLLTIVVEAGPTVVGS